jgi:hypothetical protein
MQIIDAQVHAYERNHPGRPWAGHPHGPPSATGDEMVAAMDAAGVDGALLVSPYSLYRYDASYALEVGAAHPGRFGLIKPVDPNDPAVEEIIADWAKTPGTVGIRLLPYFETSEDPADSGMNRVLAAAARYSLPVNLLCWGRLDQAKGLIARNFSTTIVIDHLGLPQPFEPPLSLTALGSAANVVRRKQKCFYLNFLSRSRHVFPRMNIRVAQKRMLHQPNAQRQKHPSASPWGELGVHDADAAAWPQLSHCSVQNSKVMRHCIVGGAEENAIERFRRLIVDCVAVHQGHITPLMISDELMCPAQHSCRQIDAIHVACVTNRLSQGAQIATRAAPDFEDPISGLQFERRHRLLAKFSGNKEQPFEQGDEPCQPIIASRNESAVAIYPFSHRNAANVSCSLWSIPNLILGTLRVQVWWSKTTAWRFSARAIWSVR